MRAKDYWVRIRDMDAGMYRRMEEIQKLEDMATRITASYKNDGASGGGSVSDKVGDSVISIVDLRRNLAKEIEDYSRAKKRAFMLLKKLPDEKYATVLHRRYLFDEKFETIADKMGYTVRNVTYLHGNALAAFQKILDEEGVE